MGYMKESPLFSKSYDFIKWLIPRTVKFPREQRFVIASRLQQRSLDFMEQLYTAAASTNRTAALLEADALLKQIRFYLRLSHDLRLLSTRQYEYSCRQIEEIGRLLGGWLNKMRKELE